MEVNCSVWDEYSAEAVDGTIVCQTAFLLYATPFIMFGVTLFFAIFLLILSRRATPARSPPQSCALWGASRLYLCVQRRYLGTQTGEDQRQAALALKAASGMVIFCLIGMYICTSIMGAGMKMGTAGFAIFGVAMFGIVAVVGATMGFDELAATLKAKAGMAGLGSFVNLARAFMFFCGLVPFVGFILLSFINQLFRRLFPCGLLKRFDTEEERRSLVTLRAQNTLKALRLWDWTSVLVYTNYLVIFMWVSKWMVQLINILFAWIIAQLSQLPSPAVAAIFALIGVCMFMIPVVPGPVVYLASGVLLTPILEAEWGGASSIGVSCNVTEAADGSSELAEAEGGWQFWVAALCACLMSYGLKLIAHVAEQKLIGEPFRKKVGVRAMVGINSRTMKAANFILTQPGVSKAKVMLLCFGPDWPTSVLAGLLGANCCQCVLALSPMLLCTTPATLMGASKTKTGTLYDTLFQVMTIMTLLTQAGGMALMAYCLQQVYVKDKEAIEAIPDDQEVAEYDAKQKRFGEAAGKVKHFSALPGPMRFLLISGTVVGLVSYYGVQCIMTRLFQAFEITACLDDLGKPSHEYAVPFMGIKYPGVIALCMLLYMLLTLFYFNAWVKKQARWAMLADDVNAVAVDVPASAPDRIVRDGHELQAAADP